MIERTVGDQPGSRASTARFVAGTVTALALLGGCATTSPQPPVTTVTVYPDETTVGGAAPSSAIGPSSVPTVAAPGESPTSTSAAPKDLPLVRVGRLRGAPEDFAQAQARVSKASATDAGATSVQSPSGNIYCATVNDGNGVACEVAKGRAKAPKEAPCPGGGGAQTVGRVELGPAGAAGVCNSDTIRTPGSKKLAYGKRWAVPNSEFICLSESAGITCIDAENDHGFFIARQTYATF